LALFEATGLPEEAFEIAPLVQTYRSHQNKIHAGQIWPIGEEPSGTSWTGFQSVEHRIDPQGDKGYLLLYREWNQRMEAQIKLWGLAGQTIRATSVAGQGKDFVAQAGSSGELWFSLPEPLSFALYSYRTA
jgi:hypothetical protein